MYSDEEAHIIVGEDEEWGGIGGSSSKKRKIEETIEAQRKKLGSSATFASNEDCDDDRRWPASPNLQFLPSPFDLYALKNADDVYPTQRYLPQLPYS